MNGPNVRAGDDHGAGEYRGAETYLDGLRPKASLKFRNAKQKISPFGLDKQGRCFSM